MKRLLFAVALLVPPTCYAVEVAGYRVTRHDGTIVFAASYETVGPFHRVRDFKNSTTLHHVNDVASIEPLRRSDLRESRELVSRDGSEWEKPTVFSPRLSYRASGRTVARHEESPGDGVCGALRQDGTYCQTPVEGGGYCPIHAKKFGVAGDAAPGDGRNSRSVASLTPSASDAGISATRQQELQRTLELRRANKARSRAAYAERQAQEDAQVAALAQQEAMVAQQEAMMAYGPRLTYRSSSRGGYYTGPRQPPGYYAGGNGSSHRGGHYMNPNTGNHYQKRY